MVVGSSVLASEDGRERGGPCALLEDYAGKSLLLTGATGFLGTALVEKILCCLQSLKLLYVLIRPSKRRAASARFQKELLASLAFRRMRKLLGDGFEGFVSQKVCVLEGDLAEEDLGLKTEELFELSREVDVVIHCAAEASFDAPLDVALDSNVLGTLRLLRSLPRISSYFTKVYCS